MKYLIAVVGPTAVGKTALCLHLAQQLDTEIISADSRQVFREMHIGTAKPTQEELALVTHHFIDSHSIHEPFNAGDYEREALEKIERLFISRDKLIITGGSGLYLKAITEGMADIPEVDEEIRMQLNQRLAEVGLEALTEELKMLDPEYYDEVDLKNPQRVTRALEVCIGTGKKYSELRSQKPRRRDFKTIKIGLNRPRKELYERINARMDVMIEQGLFDEARKLYQYRNHYALQTVGYKEIFDYMEGKYDREEAVRLLKRNTRRYAKRQLTWFGKDEEIKWFHPDDYDDVFSYIKSVTND
ncbi:tRNA delta(2)-isopentenylpyrophosphate transferase [Fulvivirga imtechensis AK7]|uniref:tRNA dimethylallyltransferase n=1 Tax=Fulvivirga imtechensis AK7 TaxID=1237149 RepID=L8JXH8_9BACT|nr:tRNA (adenosine(37)-N6)-dimethylallyltransferase MiaA [Fulvivirga imtechensis]ELR72329.1 tRNA delta(2)-isopentenylpyrophosphate transferase [Fulvivirga imtechensis AK7]